jgi:hypothetical protein
MATMVAVRRWHRGSDAPRVGGESSSVLRLQYLIILVTTLGIRTLEKRG